MDEKLLIKWRVPRTIQWLIRVFMIYLLIFTAFRIATVVAFKPSGYPLYRLLPSFWLGLKYDLRWISFLLFPIAFLSLFPKLSPFNSERLKRFWTAYLGVITLLVLFFYGADFGQFAYVNARLNADALIFAEDPRESLQMVWQSYPVVWILVGIIGSVLMMTWMFRRIHVRVIDRNSSVHKFDYRRRWHLVALLLLGWFMYGFLTAAPLNFFRAFNLNDEFRSNLALNPMQNFFTTLKFRDPDYGNAALQYYPQMKKFLGLQGNISKKDPFMRQVIPGSTALESQPNVVLVICESYSMYKSSMSGNPLDPTPFFDSLSREGIFFERCFSPSFGTARGIFALLTGVPDVQLSRFATRNEATVKQRTIINEFDGYEKFYFIGGRSQFNNFNGLVKNIKGVNIYEEGKYETKGSGVWGIRDSELFSEAGRVLSKQDKPFFAIIQTADNHRPFRIDSALLVNAPEEERLEQFGFSSVEEYIAFRSMDESLRQFMNEAGKAPWFDNTIFVFVGDHGVEGDARFAYPDAWVNQRLSEEHIPLLFYAPRLILQPQKRSETVSQVDVLPTIAGMIQKPYRNFSLGRDLLNENNRPNAAFIIYHASGWIGLVDDNYYYRKNLRFRKEELVPVSKHAPELNAAQADSVKKEMGLLTTAIYETARWMLVHNK